MACLRPSPRRVRAILALLTLLVLTNCEQDSAAPRAIPALTITVAPDRLALPIGSSATLVATVRDSDGRTLTDRTITWISSAPEVASVSAAGVVRASSPGSATISASSEPGVGFALVVVQEDFRLPVPRGRRWLLLTESGTPATGCADGEGGLRQAGGWDCTHAAVSRYSLDFAGVTLEDGVLSPDSADVLTAAAGQVIDVCLLPQGLTCGPKGPFVAMEHRGGFRTIYAHLDPASITVRRKMVLEQGQRIGTMGASGSEPGPWVHFELRFENQGAGAARILEELRVDGRVPAEYRVARGEPGFYPSSNGEEREGPAAPVRQRLTR